jgi:hypothetical protein
LSIRAGTFTVVDYGAEERVAAGVGHATVVRSTNGVPVVAERAMTQVVESDDDNGDEDDAEEPSEAADPTGDITTGPGSVVAATRWAFPSSADSDGTGFVVFNPDPERSARVTLLAVADGRRAAVGSARDVEVPAGGRVTLVGDAAAAWVVESGAPVVVERVVLRADGVRLATGPGMPSVEGAVPLGSLVGLPNRE